MTNPNGFISGANLQSNTIRHESGIVQSHYENYVVAQNSPANNLGVVAEATVEKTSLANFSTDLTNILTGKASAIKSAQMVEPCSVQQDANCTFQGNVNFAPYQSCP